RIGLQRNFFASAGGISSGGISTDGISTDGISTDGISTDVKNAVLAAAQEFEAAGAVVEEFDMPLTEYMLPAWYVIACAEASSNMARFDGLKFGYRSENARNLSDVYRLSRSEAFGMEVKRRIMFGTFVLSAENYHAYYTKAMQVRTLVKNAYNQLFDRFDVLLSPAAASAAYALGAHTGIYTGDILNAGSSLAGLPAAVLPCGFSFSPQDSQGKDCLQSNSCLPIGLQLTGKAFSEKKLVNISRIYQSRTDHHAKINGGVI
ncbi:MAG: amidase family protein, partial [Treponema sp.]|nr:amidase family protein [Treponema sp.]